MKTNKIHNRLQHVDGLLWAVVISIVVVTVAAALGKATINITGSILNAHQVLTIDVVDTLLPNYAVNEIEVLREDEEGTHLQIYAQDNVIWGIATQDTNGWAMDDWSVMHR